MGIGVVNDNLNVHRSGSMSVNEYSFKHHFGNLGIDSESPVFGPTAAASIKSAAAQSQSAFDSACESAVGTTWWNDADRDSTYKATLRALILALP